MMPTLVLILFLLFNSVLFALTLQEAVELALRNNIKSVESRIELEKVEEKIREVRSGLFPTLSLRGEFTRWDENYISSFVPTNRLFIALSVSQTVFDRSVFLAVKLANRSRELRELILQDVKAELEKEVKSLFHLTLLKRETLMEREAFFKYWKDYLLLLEEKYREGIIPKHELLRAKSQVKMAEANLKRAKAELKKAKLSLASLVGVDGELEPEGELKPLDLKVKEFSLDKNSTLRVIKKSIQLQELNRELERAEFYPKVMLQGDYQGNNLKDFENGRLKDDFRHGYSLRLQADLTLFDWGRRSAKVSQEALELERLKETFKNKERELRNNLSSLLEELEALRLEIKARELSVEASAESLRLSTERYREGIASQLEVLDAVAQYEKAKIDLLNTVYTYNTLIFELERIVGR